MLDVSMSIFTKDPRVTVRVHVSCNPVAHELSSAPNLCDNINITFYPPERQDYLLQTVSLVRLYLH